MKTFSSRFAGLSFAVLALLTACDQTSTSTEVNAAVDAAHTTTEPEQGADPVFHEMVHRVGVDRVRLFADIGDALPNVEHRRGGRAYPPVSQHVLRGDVVAVRPGFGFIPIGNPRDFQADNFVENPDWKQIAFSESEADPWYRTVHISLQVDEAFGSDAPGEAVEIGLAVPGHVAGQTAIETFSDLGGIVVFLTRSPVFAYDNGLYSIVDDGLLLATVENDGRLVFPFAAETDVTMRTHTVGDLRAEAARGPRVYDPSAGES